ncbi:MAG: ABC transporter ATP-binding protein [Bacilli bacterium]
MAQVNVENATKRFGRMKALSNVSMVFPDGAVTCILGPSGCGKTTLLRTIAGLETIDEGGIYFNDRPVTYGKVSTRNVGMVFQAPVVYRGLSVKDNVALPLRRAGMSAVEIRNTVAETLELLELNSLAEGNVDTLSAGDRQKVAIARAVARRPEVLLLDEPLTNVSAQERAVLKHALKRLLTHRRQTVIYVTHDQSEAMTLADVLAVMRDGIMVQYGPPRDLYESPAEEFVGRFLGAPGMNFLNLRGAGAWGSQNLTLLLGTEIGEAVFQSSEAARVGFRPEHVTVLRERASNAIPGEVKRATITSCGQTLMIINVGEDSVVAKVWDSHAPRRGDKVWMGVSTNQLHFFTEGGRRVDNLEHDVGAGSADVITRGEDLREEIGIRIETR